MRTIKLTGELGKKYGFEHRFSVRTPAEAVRALCVNFPEFRQDLATSEERNVGYSVLTAGEELTEEDLTRPAGRVIIIAPVIMGAGATTRIILGAVLLAVGYVVPVLSPYATPAGIGLILGGVVELLSPVPRAPKTPERPENTPSYLFNGPVNTTGQGHPVPVGYGRLIVGGALISAGIDVTQLKRGFIRQQVERTRIVEAEITEDNYLTTPPANFFRKELILKDVYLGEIEGEVALIDRWRWRFYYYETVLVEA